MEQIAPVVAGGRGGNPAQLALGRELYLGKCTKCHKPEPLGNYSLADLRDDILPRMIKKTKLTTPEADALMAYCLAACRISTEPTSRR